MSELLKVEFDIANRIETRLADLVAAENLLLPLPEDNLVKDYVRRIEGRYDVTKAKDDTDYAVSLLYIGFHATPPQYAEIRNILDPLMGNLIELQTKSESAMTNSLDKSGFIRSDLKELFTAWAEIVKEGTAEDTKDFLRNDLIKVAQKIHRIAADLNHKLNEVAQGYTLIIEKTDKATIEAQTALAKEITYRATVEAEIAEAKAEQAKLESMVKDLEDYVRKYERMANDFKQQAETAEEQSFIMGIVSVFSEVISASIPAITAACTGAATGGASLVAGAAAGTIRKMTEPATEAPPPVSDQTAKAIELKKQIADKVSEKTKLDDQLHELVAKSDSLKEEKNKLVDGKKDDSIEKEIKDSSDKDKKNAAENKKSEISGAEKRIEDNDKEIAEIKEKASNTQTAITSLTNALNALEKGSAEISKKQENHAGNLRQLQMQTLEKVDQYERERRKEHAELVKINALLKGNVSKEESIRLAIKSLGLGLTALQAMRSIIVEIAYFFHSFANFMTLVVESAEAEEQKIADVMKRDGLSSVYIKRVRRETTSFLISQYAQWVAIGLVSTKFVSVFNSGWSKLNTLKGKYLTEEERSAYLPTAAATITEIANKRQQASEERIAKVEYYKQVNG
jgi:hypothetical protein